MSEKLTKYPNFAWYLPEKCYPDFFLRGTYPLPMCQACIRNVTFHVSLHVTFSIDNNLQQHRAVSAAIARLSCFADAESDSVKTISIVDAVLRCL